MEFVFRNLIICNFELDENIKALRVGRVVDCFEYFHNY